MRALWQKIINVGIDSNTDEHEIMYIQVCNGLSILISIWMMSLIPLVLNHWPDSSVFVINAIIFPLIWPLILYINYKKHYMLARIYLTVTSIIIITIDSLSAGVQTENHLFIVMYIASAFVVYPRTKHFIIVAIVGLLHFGFMEYWFSSHGPWIEADPAYYRLIRILSMTNIPILFVIMALYHKNLLLTTQARLRERTQAFQNLLDHAGQGFLTLDRRLVVQEEYSLECRRLFGRDIAGVRFAELLHPGDAAEQSLLEDILDSVFREGDMRREVFLSLLKAEADLGEKKVALQYKWIKGEAALSDQMMVVLTDISEKRELQQRMVEERQVLRMVVWVARHYREFTELLEEYRTFAQNIGHTLSRRESSFEDGWAALFYSVHTFKGNFAQSEFVHMPSKLHDLETELAAWKRRLTDSLSDDARSLQWSAQLGEWLGKLDLPGWLEEDTNILRHYLGEQFDIGNNYVTIKLERLQALERHMRQILPEQTAEELIQAVRQLQYRPFRELLDSYPDYLAKLAERSDKLIYPVRIAGGEFLVDADRYADFARSLVHVCRNMVDHGIESPEARAQAGKDKCGTIAIEIAELDEAIRLRMSNDGELLELPAIRARALEQGICTAEQFDSMSEGEQRMLIFREGFTSRQTVDALSGRGMGLSAVIRELKRLNGAVRIDSSKESTAFTFVIPRSEVMM